LEKQKVKPKPTKVPNNHPGQTTVSHSYVLLPAGIARTRDTVVVLKHNAALMKIRRLAR